MKIAFVGLFLVVFSLCGHAQTRDADRATELNNRAVDLTDEGKETRITKENIAKALRMFEEAGRLDPFSEIIGDNHASLLERQYRLPEALQVVDTFLSRIPNSRSLRLERSFILSKMNLLAEAELERLKLEIEVPNDEEKIERQSSPMAGFFGYFVIEEMPLKPRKNEIRLEGFFRGGNKEWLDFDAMVFALPNGRFQVIPAKRKQILLNGLEPEYANLGTIPVNQLKSGDYVAAIGEQKGAHFVVRAVFVAPRTKEEAKKRGSLFDTGKLDLKEDQNYPEDLKGLGTATFSLKDGKQMQSQAATFIRDGDKTALVTSASSFYVEEQSKRRDQSFTTIASDITKKLALTQEIKGLGTYDDLFDEEKPAYPKLEANLPIRISKPYAGGEIVVADIKAVTESMSLAPKNPVRGENVFWASWNEGGMEWCDAVVTYADDNRLFLHMVDNGDGDFLPGHPIVNHKGEVVGLQVSNNEVDISGVSVEALRRAIQNPIQPAVVPKHPSVQNNRLTQSTHR